MVAHRRTRLSRPGKPWIVAWLGGALIGVANGLAREATYGRALSERSAHNVSGATAVAGFAGYFWALQRRWPIPDDRAAAAIGASWVALTVGFEFGFGRLVAGQSWDELLADYDVSEGRTWPLVLAWLAAGPAVVRHLAQPDRASRIRRPGPNRVATSSRPLKPRRS